ncbi:MAG TPA: hypothetical protein VFP89_08985 [Propionibacteriaceae bacterium]|nr:hypothetical protein [Propionibacteriaceae bacterium]
MTATAVDLIYDRFIYHHPSAISNEERLRSLAEGRGASMSATLAAALEALRRLDFYAKMAAAERELREDPVAWGE